MVDKVALSPANSLSPTAPHSFEAGTIGQLVANVPSGLNLTPSYETKNKARSAMTELESLNTFL
jgi:hypothetical protein